MRAFLIWTILGALAVVPAIFAAMSPLLQWREPIYIVAGFAGIIALAVLLFQPLIIGRHLPGLSPAGARRAHFWMGLLLVTAVFVHVGGLWLTSPPDVIDVLLFRSPTPFSVWGVVAMWAVFAAALLALLRRQLAMSVKTWRITHTTLVAVTIVGTIVHAFLIEGTMEQWTKIALSICVALAFVWVIMTKSKRGKF